MKTVNIVPDYQHLFDIYSKEAERDGKRIAAEGKRRDTSRSAIHSFLYNANLMLQCTTTAENIVKARELMERVTHESFLNLPQNKGLREREAQEKAAAVTAQA
jgi:hypothetical protein